MLPQYAVVNGAVSGAVGATNTGTFQTGDTINGSSNNALNIIQSETAAQAVTAVVNNVNTVNVRALGTNTVTYNAATWTGVNNVNLTQGVGAGVVFDTVAVTNASAATVFGYSGSGNDILNVAFTAGTNNRNFQVALNGAGTATTAGRIAYNGAATDINTISVATSGALNNATITGTTSVRTVNITGTGLNNTVTLAAGSVSTTAAVAISAANATGNVVIDIGANRLFAGSTIAGSTGTGTTTLGLQIQAAAPLTPTFTNIDALQLDAGSNGTLISGTANTSITSLTILDSTAGANTNAYTLTNFNGINSVAVGTTGAQNNQFGALTLSGTGSLAITAANQGTAAYAAANSIVLNGLNLTGYTGLTINTAGGVGSAGALTIGAAGGATDIQGNGLLQTIAITNAASGVVALNDIDSTSAVTGRGSLSLIDVSGVAGQATFNVLADALAASSVINGSVGASTITFAGGTQAGATSLVVNLQNGNNNYDGSTITTPVSQVVTAGSGNNVIWTGAGTDVITVGTGSNTVAGGAGINSVTFGSNATTGATDTYIVKNTLAAGNQTTLTNWTVASPDVIQFDVSDVGAGLMRSAGGVGGATTAVTAATAVSVGAYTGAAVTLAAGVNVISYTGPATTAANLLALVSAAGTTITLGNAAVTAGDQFLIEYLHTDGTYHVGAITLAAAATTTGATALNDIVLTGQATALAATELGFIA